MFRDSSFASVSASSIETRAGDISIDPSTFSPTSPEPPSDFASTDYSSFRSLIAMADLQDSLNDHHITSTSSPTPSYYHHQHYRTSSETDEGIVADISDSQSETSSAPSSRPTSGIWSTISPYYDCPQDSIIARRLQRQRASALQCTDAHVSRLHSLVDEMISKGDQCCLHIRSPVTGYSPVSPVGEHCLAPDEAEAVVGPAELERIPVPPYRRSGEMSRDTTCVTRSIRVRKRDPARRKRRGQA